MVRAYRSTAKYPWAPTAWRFATTIASAINAVNNSVRLTKKPSGQSDCGYYRWTWYYITKRPEPLPLQDSLPPLQRVGLDCKLFKRNYDGKLTMEEFRILEVIAPEIRVFLASNPGARITSINFEGAYSHKYASSSSRVSVGIKMNDLPYPKPWRFDPTKNEYYKDGRSASE